MKIERGCWFIGVATSIVAISCSSGGDDASSGGSSAASGSVPAVDGADFALVPYPLR